MMRHAELFLAGRILLVLMLWYSAFGKVKGFNGAANMMGSHGFPFPKLSLFVGLLWEVLGGVALLIEKFRADAAIALSVYVLIATIMVHGKDWVATRSRAEAIQVVKNLMVIGGLLCIAAV